MSNPMTTEPAATPPPPPQSLLPRAGRVPVDFEAILSAMQDQIDDLTAVVESLSRRLAERERTDRTQPQSQFRAR